MQANSMRKKSQWNYYTKLIVELPLVGWGSAAMPKFFFTFFHAFPASSSILCIDIILFKTRKQLLVPNSGATVLKHPVLDTVPVKLPCWNSPWPLGAVLKCPGILHYLCMLLQLLAFFAVYVSFAIVFCTFWCQNR